MRTGSFPGVHRPERGVDHLPPSSVEVKERVELYFYSTSGHFGLFYGEIYYIFNFTFTTTILCCCRHWIKLWKSFLGHLFYDILRQITDFLFQGCKVNPLSPELNPICYLLTLLAHDLLHVSRIRVKSLTLILLMSYTGCFIELYKFESLWKFIQRTYTTFRTVKMKQNTSSFTSDSYSQLFRPHF
jgi:hypothetical protein